MNEKEKTILTWIGIAVGAVIVWFHLNKKLDIPRDTAEDIVYFIFAAVVLNFLKNFKKEIAKEVVEEIKESESKI